MQTSFYAAAAESANNIDETHAGNTWSTTRSKAMTSTHLKALAAIVVAGVFFLNGTTQATTANERILDRLVIGLLYGAGAYLLLWGIERIIRMPPGWTKRVLLTGVAIVSVGTMLGAGVAYRAMSDQAQECSRLAASWRTLATYVPLDTDPHPYAFNMPGPTETQAQRDDRYAQQRATAAQFQATGCKGTIYSSS
jgi:hypothetical protein